MQTNQKMFIIRGNSGSGKTAVAKRLREEFEGKVALISQDTLRREILMEKDHLGNKDVIGLIEQTAVYCLNHGYTVIIEGILATQKYLEVLLKIIEAANCPVRVFYLEVSLEESIKRHATKPVASEFGEDKLREWYKPKHYLGVPGEIIVKEDSSLEETVELIKNSA